MTQLRSSCHQILVNEFDKVALSSFHDKRLILDNGISSVTYGLYRIIFEAGLVFESMLYLRKNNSVSSFCDMTFFVSPLCSNCSRTDRTSSSDSNILSGTLPPVSTDSESSSSLPTSSHSKENVESVFNCLPSFSMFR